MPYAAADGCCFCARSWYADRPEVLAWQKERIAEANKFPPLVHTLLGRSRPLHGLDKLGKTKVRVGLGCNIEMQHYDARDVCGNGCCDDEAHCNSPRPVYALSARIGPQATVDACTALCWATGRPQNLFT